MIVEHLRESWAGQRTLFQRSTEEVCAEHGITESQLAEWAAQDLIRWDSATGLDCDEEQNASFLARLHRSGLPDPVFRELLDRLPRWPSLDENQVFLAADGHWVRVRDEDPIEVVERHLGAYLDHLMEDEEEGWQSIRSLLDSCIQRLAGRIEQLEEQVRDLEEEGESS